MIKMRILFIGLVTALVLLAAAPAMAESVKCNDCTVTVTVHNTTPDELRVVVQDDKCMPNVGPRDGDAPPDTTFTTTLRFDKDAAHCQEIGMLAHNNGYFSVYSGNSATQNIAMAKWEVQIGSDGSDGEVIHINNLILKKHTYGMQCRVVAKNKIGCDVIR